MDADQAGAESKLSFIEFFLAMFNFLTSTLDTLVIAAFKLYDTDQGGDIGVPEIQNLVRMVYGEKDVAKNTGASVGVSARRRLSSSYRVVVSRPSASSSSPSSPVVRARVSSLSAFLPFVVVSTLAVARARRPIRGASSSSRRGERQRERRRRRPPRGGRAACATD